MRVDWALQKSFGWVTAVLIAIAAYFQAAGIGRLVSSAIVAGSPEPPASTMHARSFAPELFDHATVATAILARNPFDSITGPFGDAVQPDDTQAHEAPHDVGPCETARVLLISSTDDPTWSFASISADGGRSMLRRVGDEVAGYSVESIERDRVWLTSKQARCEAVLGAVVAAPKPPPSPGPAPPPGRPGSVPPDIAAGFMRTGERSFTVQRRTFEAIIARQAELLGRTRISPDKDGLRLAGVRPDSLLGGLGIQNGDHLQQINGFDIADPHTALEAYSKLMSANHLVIRALRGDQTLNFDLKID